MNKIENDLVGRQDKTVREVLRETTSMAKKRYRLPKRPRSIQIYTVVGQIAPTMSAETTKRKCTQPAYTVCIIHGTGNKIKAIGVSKHNPRDAYSPEIGIRVAYSKALKSLSENTTQELLP